MKVDIGSGGEKREGFIGVDLIDEEGTDIVCDVVKHGLPFGDDEVEIINSSHFLEHIPNQAVQPFLKECFRVLKRGGTIEILVPDLIWVIETFLKVPENSRWDFPIATIYGHQLHDGEYHKTGFTRERLVRELATAGFVVKVCMPVWSHKQQSILAKAFK